MTANRSIKCALLASFAALGGCTGMSNGAPPVVQMREGELYSDPALVQIRDAITADCLSIEQLEGDAKARRNRLVTAYMFGVDLAYNRYERNLLDAVRGNDLGASSASLLLSSVASVVGDEAIAQALSTTNSIVTGTHSAIGRDYLFSMTLNTLQTQMRASRATQRALILRRLQLPYDEWDSCTALSDVLVYEQAGTLNAALSEAAAAAAAANAAGQADVERAIQVVEPDRGPRTIALEAFVFPTDRTLWGPRWAMALRVLNAKNLFPQRGMTPNTRLFRILNFTDAAREADRRALIEGILADPNVDESLKAPLRASLAQ